jgi:hypothetical protein
MVQPATTTPKFQSICLQEHIHFLTFLFLPSDMQLNKLMQGKYSVITP